MNKLFVADCSPSVVETLRTALPEREFELVSFSDGTEVIKALDREKPDAVLLNLFLEGKDGYEVCHFFNSHDRFHKIPLFLLKGAFEPVDEERLLGLSFRELIEEPFDSQQLALKIRGAVESGDEPSALPEEPVPAGESFAPSGSDHSLREWVAEKLERSEIRIRESVRNLVLDDLKEFLVEMGLIPSKDEGVRDEEE